MLFFPFPIKAKYLVLGYGIYEVWSELNRMPGDNSSPSTLGEEETFIDI